MDMSIGKDGGVVRLCGGERIIVNVGSKMRVTLSLGNANDGLGPEVHIASSWETGSGSKTITAQNFNRWNYTE